ncbi:hypothetical protein CR513_09825, partial [Mucuna pruriens]
MAYDQVGKEKKLQLQELEELYLEACENSQIYKQKPDPEEGVLSRPESAFVQFSLKAHLELKDEATNNTFQVNGHQLKTFHEGSTPIVAQNQERLDPKEAPWSRKVQSYHTQFTLLTLSLHSAVVHGALVRHLVDQRGTGLESRKLEYLVYFLSYSIFLVIQTPLFSLSAESESSLTPSKSSPTPSESNVSVRD